MSPPSVKFVDFLDTNIVLFRQKSGFQLKCQITVQAIYGDAAYFRLLVASRALDNGDAKIVTEVTQRTKEKGTTVCN